MKTSHFTLKARTGCAFELVSGGRLQIINTFGRQVVDTWAFCASDTSEFMSMEHTRVHASTPTPVEGTVFRSNRRRPLLAFTRDTSPGIHDWFFAACDKARYEMLGHVGAHDSCTDNLRKAMTAFGHDVGHVPCPLNLFENAPLLENDMAIHPPASRPGDLVELTALSDLIICLSACPQDMADTNGSEREPRDVEIGVIT
ncbi:MAG: urea carboxylase-associated family protein [Hyphomicrobiaceae bacterium]|nr:urea carboxylase-associated family protein [Hyphomicrobiaceae bacterium]